MTFKYQDRDIIRLANDILTDTILTIRYVCWMNTDYEKNQFKKIVSTLSDGIHNFPNYIQENNEEKLLREFEIYRKNIAENISLPRLEPRIKSYVESIIFMLSKGMTIPS